MENLKKDYIKSTPFNIELHTPYFKPSEGSLIVRRIFY